MRSKSAATVAATLMVLSASPAYADDAALFVLGQAAEVEAGRSVEAAIVIGGDLTVRGHVDEAAIAVGGNVRVEPGATVDGMTAAIGGALIAADDALIVGPRVQVAGGDFSEVAAELAEAAETDQAAPPVWIGPVMRMFQVLALFVLGVFLVLLAARPLQTVRRTLEARPAQASLAGLGLMFGFIPLCVVLALSVVGLPLIPIAGLLLLAMFIMGLCGLALSVGFRVPAVKGEDNQLGALTAGMLLLLLAAALPVVGALLLFIGSFYGAGAVVVSRFGTRAPPPAAAHLEAGAGERASAEG